MNKLKLFLTLCIIYFLTGYAQSQTEVDDPTYKFKFSLPSGWSQRKVEETNKKDAISYSFEKNDGKVAVMLLAFKVNEVKNLEDFIYTLEKDLTLNIPKREGDYADFDNGNYDGRSAKYKDSEFTEIIYYYRTKITDGENFSYVLRFITPAGNFNSTVEKELREVATNFKPSF